MLFVIRTKIYQIVFLNVSTKQHSCPLSLLGINILRSCLSLEFGAPLTDNQPSTELECTECDGGVSDRNPCHLLYLKCSTHTNTRDRIRLSVP